MAIDTADKRASAIAATLAPLIVPFSPEASIDAADRQHVGGWMYRGIATSVAVAIAVFIAGIVEGPAIGGDVWGPATNVDVWGPDSTAVLRD